VFVELLYIVTEVSNLKNSMKKYTKKQAKKLFDKECFFCGENDYNLLDAHRIIEGKDGGTYHWWNMLTTCVKCHRKVHTGRIQILGKHPSTGPRLYAIHYIEDGEEKWK
jgi:5-methylcytosine-specific restriction endonuclease McrA